MNADIYLPCQLRCLLQYLARGKEERGMKKEKEILSTILF